MIAQSIRAAANTVDPTFYVHSLHCYFIRAVSGGGEDVNSRHQPVHVSVDSY